MKRFFLVLLLLTKVIFAQDLLTLNQAIELALKNSDKLNIAKEKTKQSYGDKMLSQSLLWPQLSIKSFMGTDLNKDFIKNSYLNFGARLEYSLINPSLWLKVMQSNQNFHKEQKNFDLATDLFVKEVAESYLEALSYQVSISIALEQIQDLEKSLAIAKAKKALSIIKPTDYLTTKLQLLQALANKNEQESLYEKSLSKLKLLLKEDKNFKLQSPEIKQDMFFEFDLLTPKLEGLKKDLDASKYALQSSYWEYFPKINLELTSEKKWPLNLTNSKPLESSVGLSLSMPLFGGFDRVSRIIWQKSEVAIKKVVYEQEINNVNNSIILHKKELELAIKSKNDFKKAFDLAKDILTTSKRLFELSQIDNLEMISAHNNFLTANKAYLQACITIEKILINLLFITGKITKTLY